MMTMSLEMKMIRCTRIVTPCTRLMIGMMRGSAAFLTTCQSRLIAELAGIQN
jgi:hypothetical protein